MRLNESFKLIGRSDSIFKENSKILQEPRKIVRRSSASSNEERKNGLNVSTPSRNEVDLLQFMTNDHLKTKSGEIKDDKKPLFDVSENKNPSNRVSIGDFKKIELRKSEIQTLQESGKQSNQKYNFDDDAQSISIPKSPNLGRLTPSQKKIFTKLKEISEKSFDSKTFQNRSKKFSLKPPTQRNSKRRMSLNMMGTQMFRNRFSIANRFGRMITLNSRPSANQRKAFRMDTINGKSSFAKRQKKMSKKGNDEKRIDWKRFNQEKEQLEKMVILLTGQINLLTAKNNN